MAGLVGATAGAAWAGPGGPIRVNIECESPGRTKACPAFLLGFVEATPLLRSVPRAAADVVLYVSAAPIANDDRLHLRFVGEVKGAPASIELDVDVDSRATDDEQRAQLEPAFLRGIALYVAVRHPDAVTVTLDDATGEVVAGDTTPWGVSVELAGFGSWTGPYKSANGAAQVAVTRLTAHRRLYGSLSADGSISRSPAVGGVSFDTTTWGFGGVAMYVRDLNPCWAMLVHSSARRDDPKGQFRYGWDGQVGLEWDRYASDDPRGNVLAIGYGVGYRVEGYNFRNLIGERFAQYPQHTLGAAASLRRDKISYNLSLHAESELIDPTRRFSVSATPGVEIKLGDHVDLSLELSVTRRELPAFDIPEDDPEAIGRAAYAQPTSAYGSASVRFHWDATNGARNNRFVNL